MKLETKSVINRQVVVKIAESRGIAIYENKGDEVMFVCKGDDVVFELSVSPSCVEGLGGDIGVAKL